MFRHPYGLPWRKKNNTRSPHDQLHKTHASPALDDPHKPANTTHTRAPWSTAVLRAIIAGSITVGLQIGLWAALALATTPTEALALREEQRHQAVLLRAWVRHPLALVGAFAWVCVLGAQRDQTIWPCRAAAADPDRVLVAYHAAHLLALLPVVPEHIPKKNEMVRRTICRWALRGACAASFRR